ncbi:unnamed protein product [Candidula unifasciata]|uniref:Geranylgeranyl transferase type-2 subunit alpha n=1 Tax=Candidula unifasciata TaxID=100452 RepID=A0A8S3YMF2_9EUPU|nr:unnamed protein product [Candidula unifasciata]
MHGRLKVKSTAEQLEAKKKEREKKLQLYNAATSKIISKKKNGELDEELLLVSAEVLAVNPDFYTLWNYRKETFLELQKTKSKEELQKMFLSELIFLESCLRVNHKSYGTWHHRCFVMDTMPEPDWNRELELCNDFLKYDERNFHCWDYRRFVVKRANVPPEAELKFSLSKINNNFSNYSSWHYRSKLLPVLYPDPKQPMGVSEEALLKEYELVQNGFFTDPDDQSNWFYHRWLMGRGEQVQGVNCFIVSRLDNSAIVSFTKHIKVGKATDIVLEINNTRQEHLTWHNPDRSSLFSTMWISFDGYLIFSLNINYITNDLCLPKNEECSIRATLIENDAAICSSCLHLDVSDDSKSVTSSRPSGSSQFSQELSALKSDVLQQELQSILELMEMETDNKWVVLTVVLLMKALDPFKYEMEIMNNLDRLEALDFKRVNYYKDLRSKFLVENLIDTSEGDIKSVDLKGKKLTKLYHTELLPLVTVLDLSDNHVQEAKYFNHLQSLVELNLSTNGVQNCEGLQHLPKLEKLLLRDNRLSSPLSFQPLQSCPKLKHLNISGNPICESEDLIEQLRELLTGVEIILKSS